MERTLDEELWNKFCYRGTFVVRESKDKGVIALSVLVHTFKPEVKEIRNYARSECLIVVGPGKFIAIYGNVQETVVEHFYNNIREGIIYIIHIYWQYVLMYKRS